MSATRWRWNPCCLAAGVVLCGSALAAMPGHPSGTPPSEADWTSVALSMGLPEVAEAGDLVDAGTDFYGRRLRLAPGAQAAWRAMRAAARADGVELVAISGYRSRAKQAELVRAKLRRGMALRNALSINAVPGYSEHHGGYALDIGTPGSPAAEEVFEHTAAFRWLQVHAQAYGFSLSYPRGNPHGIAYEPWHWAWRDSRLAAAAGSAAPATAKARDEPATPGMPNAPGVPDPMALQGTPGAPSDARPSLVSAEGSPPPMSTQQLPAETETQ